MLSDKVYKFAYNKYNPAAGFFAMNCLYFPRQRLRSAAAASEYQPRSFSVGNLWLMRQIDELHLNYRLPVKHLPLALPG